MTEKKQVKLTQRQLIQTFSDENNRLEDLNARLNNSLAALQEISGTIEAISALSKAGEKEKILVPLGSGIFLHATAEDKQKVLVSLAGGIISVKKGLEVKEELEKRKAELGKILENTKKEHNRLSQNVNTLAQVIRQTQSFAQQRKTN